MSINTDDYDYDRPLVDNLARYHQITERISDDIHLVKEYTESLENCRDKMGTTEDTRTLRKKLHSQVIEGNDLIKKILEQFHDLEELEFKKRKDKESCNKLTRRLNNSFEDAHSQFTKVLKDIHSKERIYIGLQQSLTLHASSSIVSEHSGRFSDHHTQTVIHEVSEAMQDLDFYATILEERESQIRHTRELAGEMNMLAQYQAQKIKEQGEDIEVLVEDTEDTEGHTKKANEELEKATKYQKRATTKNLTILIIIVIVCIVVVAIVVSNGV